MFNAYKRIMDKKPTIVALSFVFAVFINHLMINAYTTLQSVTIAFAIIYSTPKINNINKNNQPVPNVTAAYTETPTTNMLYKYLIASLLLTYFLNTQVQS